MSYIIINVFSEKIVQYKIMFNEMSMTFFSENLTISYQSYFFNVYIII